MLYTGHSARHQRPALRLMSHRLTGSLEPVIILTLQNTKESKMAVATIKLVNAELMGSFYFTSDPIALARKMLQEGFYKVQGTMGVPGMEGMDAAEEIFDLTNNPSRQEEREELYGQFRSVSVGDIVNVDGADWLCCKQGWRRM